MKRQSTAWRKYFPVFAAVELFNSVTPRTAACQASLSSTGSQSCSKSCPSSRWCHPTISSSVIPFSSCLQSFPAFSNESALCIRRPKDWSFSISPSNEYSGLISFRIDCFDLLAIQGTLKNLLQHHSSKASVLQHSAFFIVPLSNPYMTTGKTIALTRWTLAKEVTSLLPDRLSKFVIASLPRNKCLIISRLQSQSTVILEPKKIKSATISIVSPSICHEVMGLDDMINFLQYTRFSVNTENSKIYMKGKGIEIRQF